jgi:hypothetical protein
MFKICPMTPHHTLNRTQTKRINTNRVIEQEKYSATQYESRYIDAVKVVCAEAGVAFGTLSLARFVARLETREAKDVEAFGEDGVFALDFARRTRHLFFVLLQLLC